MNYAIEYNIINLFDIYILSLKNIVKIFIFNITTMS